MAPGEAPERKSAPPIMPSGKISCSTSTVRNFDLGNRQSMPPPLAIRSDFRALKMPNFSKIH